MFGLPCLSLLTNSCFFVSRLLKHIQDSVFWWGKWCCLMSFVGNVVFLVGHAGVFDGVVRGNVVFWWGTPLGGGMLKGKWRSQESFHKQALVPAACTNTWCLGDTQVGLFGLVV